MHHSILEYKQYHSYIIDYRNRLNIGGFRYRTEHVNYYYLNQYFQLHLRINIFVNIRRKCDRLTSQLINYLDRDKSSMQNCTQNIQKLHERHRVANMFFNIFKAALRRYYKTAKYDDLKIYQYIIKTCIFNTYYYITSILIY